MPHEDAVLADQRHDVGDRGEGDEVEQVKRQVRRQAERRHQRLHQLEGDAGAAEHAEPGGIVGPLGIDDGDGRRQLGTGKVMVGDDDVDAALPARAAPCRPR